MARSATTWKKGQSGNPKGRPPGADMRLTEALRRMADPELLARALIDMAMEPYLPALIYVFNRLEGKPKETYEINPPMAMPKVVWFEGRDDEDEPVHDDDEE